MVIHPVIFLNLMISDPFIEALSKFVLCLTLFSMKNLQKKYDLLMDKIPYNENLTRQDQLPNHTKRSRSQRSNASEAALKRAKAEAEKVKLKFAEQEAALKKEQFDKTLQIEFLSF